MSADNIDRINKALKYISTGIRHLTFVSDPRIGSIIAEISVAKAKLDEILKEFETKREKAHRSSRGKVEEKGVKRSWDYSLRT